MSQFFTPNVDAVDHPDGHVLVVGDIAVGSASDGAVAPAGAAQVAILLSELGHKCSLIGFVGDDKAGVGLLEKLQHAAISPDVLAVPQWSTYAVTSQMAISEQEALGEVPEQQRVLPFGGMSEYQAHLQNRVERGIRNARLLVIVDQGYGSVGDPRAAVFAATQCQIPSLVLCAPLQKKNYSKANLVVEVGSSLETHQAESLPTWLLDLWSGFNGTSTQ